MIFTTHHLRVLHLPQWKRLQWLNISTKYFEPELTQACEWGGPGHCLAHQVFRGV
jgi:hypothetical protein